MGEKLNLKWKTFPDLLVGAFKEIGTHRHFADVNLVSDDQTQILAHKVLLSACSPVMKTLLVNNPHSYPLIYFRGIKHEELQGIVNFMYFGFAEVSSERIDTFFSVAKDFELNLMTGNDKKPKYQNKIQIRIK